MQVPMPSPIAPKAILFDWHGTLVDTMVAMYSSMDDVLRELDRLDLLHRLADPQDHGAPRSGSGELVRFVRQHRRLPPHVQERKEISRTELLEVLFGSDEKAKEDAHRAYNRCYRRHYGKVAPYEQQSRTILEDLAAMDVKLGVVTNRAREFLDHELAVIEGAGWTQLFDTVVAGDQAVRLKPAPDPLLLAASRLGIAPGGHVWYVGDSPMDVTAAKAAAMTSAFYNRAQWDIATLHTIFHPGRHGPPPPDVVVNELQELLELVRRCQHASSG